MVSAINTTDNAVPTHSGGTAALQKPANPLVPPRLILFSLCTVAAVQRAGQFYISIDYLQVLLTLCSGQVTSCSAFGSWLFNELASSEYIMF